MKNVEATCPGCHKHCSLASPRCRIGKEYARTGVPQDNKASKHHVDLPEAENAGESKTHSSEVTLFSDEKLTQSLRFVSHALRHEKGTLAPLSDTEKAQLDALLTKLREGWGTEEASTSVERHSHKKHGHRHSHGGH
jgi:hypothetical protein